MIYFTPTLLDSMEWPSGIKIILADLDSRARELDKAEDHTFAEIGLICVTMESRKLWAELGFRSFAKWLGDAFPRSRSTAFDAFDVIGKLLPVWPWERITEARIVNLKTAAEKFSTKALNDPEMMESAAGPSTAFNTLANEKHNQCIPLTKPYVLAPDEVQRAKFDALVAMVRELESDPQASMTQCFEHAADYCLSMWQTEKESSAGQVVVN